MSLKDLSDQRRRLHLTATREIAELIRSNTDGERGGRGFPTVHQLDLCALGNAVQVAIKSGSEASARMVEVQLVTCSKGNLTFFTVNVVDEGDGNSSTDSDTTADADADSFGLDALLEIYAAVEDAIKN